MGYFYPDKVNNGVAYINYAINHINNAVNKVNKCNNYMFYKIKNRLYYNLGSCSSTISGYKSSANNIKNNINNVISEYYRISNQTASTVIQKAEINASAFNMQLSNDLQWLGMNLENGFNTVVEIGSSNLENLMQAGENLGNTILNTADNFITGAQKLGNDAMNFLNELGNNAKTAFEETGAAIIEGASNWWEDIVNNKYIQNTLETLKNTGATILSTAATGLAAIVNGLGNLGESLVDFVVLAGAVVLTSPATIIDVASYFINGENAGALETLWGTTQNFVATEYVNDAFNWAFTETELGQMINENSMLKYGSDGYNVVTTLSEIAGTIALTILTGGAYGAAAGGGALATTGAKAGATALTKSFAKNSAKVAFASGTGRGSQEAYNSNIAIVQIGENDNFSLDLKRDELNKLNSLQAGEIYTKQAPSVDENGNQITMQFDFVKNPDGTISVTIDGQTFNTTINEVNAMEGLTYGLANGAWDGFQWYAGGKLGGLGLKAVGFDVASGAAEVPLRSSMQGIYSDNTWNERFETNGGAMGVITNMSIAGVLSGVGETSSIKRFFGNENKAADFKSKVQTAKANASATVNKTTSKAKDLKDKLSDTFNNIKKNTNTSENIKTSKTNDKKTYVKKEITPTFTPIRQGLQAIKNIASAPFMVGSSFVYTPIAKNAKMPLKVYTEGLYHLTNENAADSIISSGNVRASNNLISYGSKKSFFFAGIPDAGNVAYNVELTPTAVAVKVKPKAEHLKLFDYRSLGDRAVTHQGDLDITDMDVSKVYLGLKNDNGNLVYKEITKEEYDNYHLDLTEEQMSLIDGTKMAKIKSSLYGFNYVNDLQLQLFSKALSLLKDNKFKLSDTLNSITKNTNAAEISGNIKSKIQTLNQAKNDLKANITNIPQTALSHVENAQNIFRNLILDLKNTGASITKKAKSALNNSISPVYNLKANSPLDWLFNKLADKEAKKASTPISPEAQGYIKQFDVSVEYVPDLNLLKEYRYWQSVLSGKEPAHVSVNKMGQSIQERMNDIRAYLGEKWFIPKSSITEKDIVKFKEKFEQAEGTLKRYAQGEHPAIFETTIDAIDYSNQMLNSLGYTLYADDVAALRFVMKTMDNKYGAGQGLAWLRQTVEDGNYANITRTNGARDIVMNYNQMQLKEFLEINDIINNALKPIDISKYKVGKNGEIKLKEKIDASIIAGDKKQFLYLRLRELSAHNNDLRQKLSKIIVAARMDVNAVKARKLPEGLAGASSARYNENDLYDLAKQYFSKDDWDKYASIDASGNQLYESPVELTQHEKNVIFTQTKYFGCNLNMYLRGSARRKTRIGWENFMNTANMLFGIEKMTSSNIIETYDNIIKKCRLKQDIVTYSGIRDVYGYNNQMSIKDLKPGVRFGDAGYRSSALVEGYEYGGTHKSIDEQSEFPIQLEITTPAGFNAAYIESYTGLSAYHVQEVIHPRNTILEITDFPRVENGKTIIPCRVVEQLDIPASLIDQLENADFSNVSTNYFEKYYTDSSDSIDLNDLYTYMQNNALLDKLELEFNNMRGDGLYLRHVNEHDIDHIERVMTYACYMAKKKGLVPDECDIIREAAKYHDAGMKSLKDEIPHGQSSAKLAMEKLNADDDYDPEEINMIGALIEYHELPDSNEAFNYVADKYNILSKDRQRFYEYANILKDADAIDRVRFPGNLDTRYLRNKNIAIPLIKAASQLQEIRGAKFIKDGITLGTFNQNQLAIINELRNRGISDYEISFYLKYGDSYPIEGVNA